VQCRRACRSRLRAARFRFLSVSMLSERRGRWCMKRRELAEAEAEAEESSIDGTRPGGAGGSAGADDWARGAAEDRMQAKSDGPDGLDGGQRPCAASPLSVCSALRAACSAVQPSSLTLIERFGNDQPASRRPEPRDHTTRSLSHPILPIPPSHAMRCASIHAALPPTGCILY
jgi:hypothetical protein